MPLTMPMTENNMPETGQRPVLRIHSPRAQAVNDPQPHGGGIKPLAYLKYRWVTVLFVGGFLGALLAAVAWKMIPSKYTTSSLVRVLNYDPVVHTKEDPQGRNDFAIYLKSQVAMIKSHFVLNSALRDPAVASTAMLREQSDPIRYLEEELKVEYQEGSEILKISLAGDDPRAIALIVNSVQEAYFREVVDEEIKSKKSRLRQLEDSISRMKEDIKNKYKRIKESEVQEKVKDLIPGLGAQIAAHQVVRLQDIVTKTETDIRMWEDEKKSLEKRLKNPADEIIPLPPSYLEQLDHDAKIVTLLKKIEQAQKRVDYLVFLAGTQKVKSVDDLKKKIEEMQAEREKFKKDRIEEYHNAQLPQAEKKIKADLEKARTTLAELTRQKENQTKMLEEYRKSLEQNGPLGDTPPDFVRVDAQESAKIITSMMDKANLLKLEVNAPPRVRDFQRAAVPLKKDTKKQLLGTIAAAFFGCALVGLAVIGFEARIKRLLSLNDLRNTELLPIVGVLPTLPSGPTELLKQEEFAESLDKTRQQFLQQFSRPGCKIVVVTSAFTEEGKGLLATQFSGGLPLMGWRTLLLDFDFRFPRLHQQFAVDNSPGSCEVLLGQCEFDKAIYKAPNGLHFIPAGTWNAGIRPLMTDERIKALFDWLRTQYDCVVLNAHPLLSVADTALFCRHADGVLLSTEKIESRLPLVARAQEKLAAMAPEALGIVYMGANTDECLN